ncbi:MAG: hypothetical protein NZ750_13555 [Anaerolineae bacterium]|nr:hypothetical protein [Anaerolineae bacterium]MDW8172825.1 hypothetical protein [Anaerolineae bacterium]
MRRPLSVLFLFVLLWPSLPAQACSGGGSPPPLAQSVDQADAIVEGRVLRVDRWGKNFIFEVRKYLKGQGPRLLLVQRISNAHSRSYYDAELDLSCAYDGVSGVREGEGYTLFLRANAGGTFSTRMGLYYSEWNDLKHETRADEWQPMVRVDEDSEWIPIESPQHFAALIESLIGPPPQFERGDYDHWMPLFAPLFARTRDGAVYRFSVRPEGQPYKLNTPPLDEIYQPFSLPNMFSPLPACREVGCVLRSPDEVYGLWWEDDGLRFDSSFFPYYQDSTEFQRLPEAVANWRMPGQAGLFSPSSDAFVVWDGARLSVWGIGTMNSDNYTGAYYPTIQILHELSLNGDDPVRWSGVARWSADGSYLVYQDAEGLWLLDVYGTTGQRLVVPSAQLGRGQLLAVSVHGRYIAYGTPQGWIVYDHIFDESWPNALISPNERHRLSLSDEQLRRPLLWTSGAEYLAYERGRVRTQRADLRSVNYDDDRDNVDVRTTPNALLAYTPYGRSTAVQTGERQVMIQHSFAYQSRTKWTVELPPDSAPLEALWWGAPLFIPMEGYAFYYSP